MLISLHDSTPRRLCDPWTSWAQSRILRQRRRRSKSKTASLRRDLHFSSSVYVAKEQTDLHTGYATAVETLTAGEMTRAPTCACTRRVWVRTRVGPTSHPEGAAPERFKDSSPGAAQGDLSRNMCQQVLPLTERPLGERLPVVTSLSRRCFI